MNFPLSPLERRIDSLSSKCVFWLAALSTIGLGTGNYLLHPIGIHLSPLFVLPICFVCWRLNVRMGLPIAVIAAVLSVAPDIEVSKLLALGTASNFMIHAVAFATTAGVVSRFRARCEQESILARHDGVTGVLTRRAFEQKAQAMAQVAVMHRRPLLLAYLDLDGFKSVNDRYGHEAGDQVLKSFGIEGSAAIRREDCFGRVGGDEFALLMLLPAIEEAHKAAVKLHERFTEALANTAYPVTCSMGALAIEPNEGEFRLEDSMRKADQLMYAAKYGGKDGLQFAVAAALNKESSFFADDGGSGRLWSRSTSSQDMPEIARGT